MRKRVLGALLVSGVITVGAAGTASASGFDSNHGKPADSGSCIASFSNGGAQAGFIQDVQAGGPGAVGQQASGFGQSGGNGHVAKNDCA